MEKFFCLTFVHFDDTRTGLVNTSLTADEWKLSSFNEGFIIHLCNLRPPIINDTLWQHQKELILRSMLKLQLLTFHSTLGLHGDEKQLTKKFV